MAKIKSACLDGDDTVTVYLDSDNIIMLHTDSFTYKEHPPWLKTDGESLYLPDGKRLTLHEICRRLMLGVSYG